MSLIQDPENIVVRIHSQLFVSSLIKKYQIMDNSKEDVQLIISVFTELVQQDIQQTISGIKIIKNFIQRYSNFDKSSPLGNIEIFQSIIRSLWSQFTRQEISNPKFYTFVTNAIILLCKKSPTSTSEKRKQFCLEVINRFHENALTLYESKIEISEKMMKIQSSFLDIFSQCLYSIKDFIKLDKDGEKFIDNVFDYLSQFLPKAEKIPFLLKAIGNIIITIQDKSYDFESKIIDYMIQALPSKILT